MRDQVAFGMYIKSPTAVTWIIYWLPEICPVGVWSCKAAQLNPETPTSISYCAPAQLPLSPKEMLLINKFLVILWRQIHHFLLKAEGGKVQINGNISHVKKSSLIFACRCLDSGKS